MILLTGTTHALELETGAALSTDYSFSFIEITEATKAIDLDSTTGNVATATTTSVISAPASGKGRQLKYASIVNRDATGTQTIIVKRDISGTEYRVFQATLRAGEMVEYDGRSWRKLSANGEELVSNRSAPPSKWLMMPHFASTNLTSVRTTTSAVAYAYYMGVAPRSLSAVKLRLRVTTAAATITWAEVAIGTGPVNPGGNPTITVRGYLDASAILNSTGQKTIDIPVSSGQWISEGDDLWAIVGASATTALVVRAVSIADDLQIGFQASLSNRPSTNVGVSQVYTLESATTTPMWLALGVW